MTTEEILKRAKNAKNKVCAYTTEIKNNALLQAAKYIELNAGKILKENETDILNAKGKISNVMIDRLKLDNSRIKAMADGIREVVKLNDPVGRIIDEVKRPNGLVIKKVSVPLGVVAVIYESRPNVTSDAAALIIKSGNVCILKSGSDAYKTSKAIVEAMKQGFAEAGADPDLVNIIDDTTREGANKLMKADEYIDLLIPRGGAGLIKACVENASVPCIQTGTGICHIYIDEFADIDKALDIVENAKASRPSVCNAAEVCLVNEKIAKKFLPLLKNRLTTQRIAKGQNEVKLICDEKSYAVIGGTRAGDKDFDTEFLDYILAVKVVKNVTDAVEHILKHSTMHSEAIVTENKDNAEYFCKFTDSAAVYVNASTRFTDGGEFGLGCEIGISTQKLHARGPMGLCELNTYKYIVNGNGQIR